MRALLRRQITGKKISIFFPPEGTAAHSKRSPSLHDTGNFPAMMRGNISLDWSGIAPRCAVLTQISQQINYSIRRVISVLSLILGFPAIYEKAAITYGRTEESPFFWSTLFSPKFELLTASRLQFSCQTRHELYSPPRWNIIISSNHSCRTRSVYLPDSIRLLKQHFLASSSSGSGGLAKRFLTLAVEKHFLSSFFIINLSTETKRESSGSHVAGRKRCVWLNEDAAAVIPAGHRLCLGLGPKTRGGE